MNYDETEQRLRELRSLREQGLITPEEAYRRHEAIMRDANRVAETADEAPPVEAEAPSPPPVPQRVLLAAGLGILVVAVLSGLAFAGILNHAQDRTDKTPEAVSTTIRPDSVPTVTPTPGRVGAVVPTGTPPAGCYNVRSTDDTVEVLSADPPIGGPPPAGSIRIVVRYTLASHNTARLVLQQGNGGQGSITLGASVTIVKGAGVVVLQQSTSSPDPNATYFIYMHPPADAYLPGGYTCWTPLVSLRLNYVR